MRYGYWAGWPTDGGVGSPPTVKLVLAHLFYLQGLLYCPNLSPVLWTLCLELQFYATYLLLLGLAQRLKISVFWPVFALGFLSLCFSVSGGYSKQYLPLIIDAHRSLLPMFSMFAIGIVLWLHHARLIPLLLCTLWIGFVCLRMKLWFQYYMFGAARRLHYFRGAAAEAGGDRKSPRAIPGQDLVQPVPDSLPRRPDADRSGEQIYRPAR